MCCNNYVIPISVAELILSQSNNLKALTTVSLSHTVNTALLSLHYRITGMNDEACSGFCLAKCIVRWARIKL